MDSTTIECVKFLWFTLDKLDLETGRKFTFKDMKEEGIHGESGMKTYLEIIHLMTVDTSTFSMNTLIFQETFLNCHFQVALITLEPGTVGITHLLRQCCPNFRDFQARSAGMATLEDKQNFKNSSNFSVINVKLDEFSEHFNNFQSLLHFYINKCIP